MFISYAAYTKSLCCQYMFGKGDPFNDDTVILGDRIESLHW